MLVISRKANESFTIGDSITVTVCNIRLDQGQPIVRIGIDAPKELAIHRSNAKAKYEKPSDPPFTGSHD